MPITREEALHILDLDANIAPDEVDNAINERREQIQKRIDSAPTDALKDKYRRQLQEIDDAKVTLLGGAAIPTGSKLSQTLLHDLPLAQASYTRVDGTSHSAAGSVMLQVGQALGNGRYQIEEQIGAGGMGVVYRAFDKNRDKDIAIKVLLPSLLSHGKARERFLQEARLSSEMSHPHIVTVFDVQQDGPHTFLTMELLKGQALRNYLDNLKKLRKTMTVDDAMKIIDHVCQGLAYAHSKSAVHRDIKPENIWLTENGQAKVMDFGIARLISTSHFTQTQMAIGTAYYMAPEQLQGLADIDGRADQYAVAIMLYEMLTGAIPTGRIESLAKVNKAIPKALSLAVDKALEPKRENRCHDITDFLLQLQGKGRSRFGSTLKMVGLSLAGIAIIAGLIVALPGLKGLLPNKDLENATKQDVARLEGEVKSLQKRIDERRREVETASQTAKREVERLTGQITNARSEADKQKLELDLWGIRNNLAKAEFIEQGFRVALEGDDGLVASEGNLRAAEAAQKANQWQQAKKLYEETESAYLKLKAVPEQLQTTLKTQREKLLHPINGKWAENDCQNAPSWNIKDPIISIFWPKHGVFEEKIMDVSDDGVISMVISPENYKGRLYRYQINGNSMEQSDVTSGGRQVMKRCK